MSSSVVLDFFEYKNILRQDVYVYKAVLKHPALPKMSWIFYFAHKNSVQEYKKITGYAGKYWEVTAIKHKGEFFLRTRKGEKGEKISVITQEKQELRGYFEEYRQSLSADLCFNVAQFGMVISAVQMTLAELHSPKKKCD